MHPISQLIIKYNRREITPEETKILLDWVSEQPERQALFTSLTKSAPLEEQLLQYMEYDEHLLLEKLNRLKQETGPSGARVVYIMTRYRWIAVAALVLVIGGGYLLFLHRPAHTPAIQQPVASAGDVAPGGNKAVLTLSGGKKIILDSAANGLLAEQGAAHVRKLDDGRLLYSKTDNRNKKTGEVSFNTLSTPRGGQYNVRLPDGTQVWLNAASSITFPTAFVGKERRVTITGEGYLEVAPDPGKPFLVNVNDLEVRVLGTHFDISAYPDETGINTTLLQGSVQVRGHGRQVTLQPGQQAQAVNGAISVSPLADIEQVTAWKNGYFKFNSTPLTGIMRQVERWYDVDIIYRTSVEKLTFSGRMPRREYVSQVLKMLEETGVGHFTIEGRTIKVSR